MFIKEKKTIIFASRFWFYSVIIFVIVIRFLVLSKSFKDGQVLKISARVSTPPVNYGSYQKVALEGFSFFVFGDSAVNYGDYLTVVGKVKGRALVETKIISVLPSKSFLLRFRQKILGVFQKNLPEPYAALVAGITLGFKENLPNQFRLGLKKAGLTHVVVASGMNLTFVASYLLSFLTYFLPRKKALSLVLVGIWFYAALCGFEGPVVRAGFMLSFAYLAQIAGRLISVYSALLNSALVMLLIKPLWIQDLGFILSFAATASLILFQKRVANFFKFIPQKLFFLKEGLVTSISAQIGVFPIIWATFGSFSLVSPFVNALVLWSVPYIMLWGSLGGVIGLIFPFLGKMILYLTYPLTWFFVKIVEIAV